MELEGIMLSEISQVEKDKCQIISLFVEYKSKGKSEGTKQQQNHRTQEWTNRGSKPNLATQKTN